MKMQKRSRLLKRRSIRYKKLKNWVDSQGRRRAISVGRTYVRSDIGGLMDGPTLRGRLAGGTRKLGTAGLSLGLSDLARAFQRLTVQVDELSTEMGLAYRDLDLLFLANKSYFDNAHRQQGQILLP